MKTANFLYEYKSGSNFTWKIYGTVTVKNDGKVSVSIHNARNYHSAACFKAKQCAQEIVKANFNHPAIQGSIWEQDKSLVNVLLAKTTALHVAYIEYTKKWCVKRYISMGQFLEKTEEEHLNQYCIKFEHKTASYLPEGKIYISPILKDQHDRRNYYHLQDDLSKFRKIREEGYKKYQDKEVAAANRHYNDSICKLSDRLMKKGVDVKKMTIKTAQVGINIEITIECNGVITRAWTIVAEGEIQRAHYRYLVK